MADAAAELREALERLIEQRANALLSSYGLDAGNRSIAPTHPHGGSVDATQDVTFSTGYSGGVTVLPFTWGLSLWGDSDVWTA